MILWTSRDYSSRHTFNYDLINSPYPSGPVSSVWRIPPVPRREKLHDRHPTQKPLRLARRTLLARIHKGDLVFDPFVVSRTTALATRELNFFFAGAELEKEFAELAAHRIGATEREGVLPEISEQTWGL
jgi:site-specific DNA-methyltransferase (adenine-specific)